MSTLKTVSPCNAPRSGTLGPSNIILGAIIGAGILILIVGVGIVVYCKLRDPTPSGAPQDDSYGRW